MSISPLSSILTAPPSVPAAQNNPRQDFTELASALQSGDLAGAQQAYAAFEQLQGGPAGSSSSSTSNSPIATDFAALGKALASGNLSQAQSAFSQLQSDFKSSQTTSGSQTTRAHGHHHHHTEDAQDTASTSSASSSSTTGDTGNTTGTTATGTVNLVG